VAVLTMHAEARLRQRGLRERDVEFILRFGTDHGDRVILSAQDVQRIIIEAKRMITMAERLRNKTVVANDGEIITVFHANRREQHRLLHG
jgi:hypothetical protein